MGFDSPIHHPNIHPNAGVCDSASHTPGDDPTMYRQASERVVACAERRKGQIKCHFDGHCQFRRS
ncbi:hypothetical protein BKA83DRAFT_4312070 [Pisolithus microcarpus]|nr:hypothetical protein BKA83DRAFT_4312070 [Pisolithus microcarpus]